MKIHQSDIAALTHQTVCLLCGFQRDILIYVTPHKGKTVQTTTFIWVYFTQIIRQILTMEIIKRYKTSPLGFGKR